VLRKESKGLYAEMSTNF